MKSDEIDHIFYVKERHISNHSPGIFDYELTPFNAGESLESWILECPEKPRTSEAFDSYCYLKEGTAKY